MSFLVADSAQPGAPVGGGVVWLYAEKPLEPSPWAESWLYGAQGPDLGRPAPVAESVMAQFAAILWLLYSGYVVRPKPADPTRWCD